MGPLPVNSSGSGMNVVMVCCLGGLAFACTPIARYYTSTPGVAPAHVHVHVHVHMYNMYMYMYMCMYMLYMRSTIPSRFVH